MIGSFRHKGLARFFEEEDGRGIQANHRQKLRMILNDLASAATVQDLDRPGFRLHQLRGSQRGRWSIWVNGNWRITFKFANGTAFDVDYEDYH